MVLIQFPPKSTAWLKVLAEDPPGNLTFQRNLSLGNKELGFTLKTNENGYRGESFNGQKYMAVGTSFGASVGVDEEDAWFNNLLCNVSGVSQKTGHTTLTGLKTLSVHVQKWTT